ncbi:MAG: GGDEF domain-containing protein [Ahniella sp.]|nr:GGDEF domain-containing protein [Ahniella sp.]
MWLLMVALLCGFSTAHGFVPPRPASERITLPFQEQTMSMAFAPSGELYVGTGVNLHRFDGTRWQGLGLESAAPIRSLHVDRNGRIWIGGYDRFGYLERLANGEDRFVDVSEQFRDAHEHERIADIWEFAETGDAIYLRALKHLFAVDHSGRRIGAWTHPGRLGEPAIVGGELWAQFRGAGGGFRRLLPNGGSEPVPGTETFADPLILNVIEFAPDRLLIFTNDGRLRWFNPLTGTIDVIGDQPAFRHIHRVLRTGPEELVGAGDDGVLRAIDLRAQLVTELDIGHGYQPSVQSLPDNRIAVLDDASVHRLSWPVPWRIIDARNGLKGNPRRHAQIGDRLYALGSSGAQSAAYQTDGITSDFRDEDWTVGEAWDLVGQPEEMLLAETFTVSRIAGGKTEAITADDLYPRRFMPMLADDGYWLGTEHGVARLLRRDGKWQLAGRSDNAGVVVHSLAECGDTLFAGSETWGAYRVELKVGSPTDLKPLQSALGIPAHKDAEVFRFEGRCYVSIPGQILEWDGQAFHPERSLELTDKLASDELVRVTKAPDGVWWALANGQILFRSPGQAWEVLFLHGQSGIHYQDATILPDGRLLLSQGSELWQLVVAPQAMPKREPTPLRATRLRLLGGAEAGNLPLDGSARILSGTEGIQIEFTDGVLFADDVAEYAFRLDGLDAPWSPYSSLPATQLSALPPGQYRLDLRVRRRGVERTQTNALQFVVAPRWYEGNGTRMAVLTAGIGLLWALIALWYRGHVRRLTESNRRLDELVNERTAKWQQANLELKQQADRDGLTGVANRRVFDRELDERMRLALRDGAPFALLMIDVDHFKRFNDEFGHLRGDEVLKQVATLMADALRGEGLLARYGGEEFAVLLYDECASARATGERLRLAVETGAGGITASIGLACFDRRLHQRADQIIDAADNALYEAKDQGRNRLIVSEMPWVP